MFVKLVADALAISARLMQAVEKREANASRRRLEKAALQNAAEKPLSQPKAA